MMRMLFSKRFSSKLPPRFQELRNAIEFIFKNLSSGNPGDMIPALRKSVSNENASRDEACRETS